MTQASATKEVAGSKFSMRGLAMLASGISTDPVAWCDGLWIHAKVYSRGGENALHAHTDEAHAFFVLQGEATFSFGDGSTTHVSQYEGVMLPRNAMYCFEARAKRILS